MRKWLPGLAVVATVIFIVVVKRETHTALVKFSVGKVAPRGKITPQLVGARDRAVLLAPDGSLWSWGAFTVWSNVRPNVFLVQTTNSASPQRIGSDSDWSEVAADSGHTLALKNNGSLWGWGQNFEGALAQSNPIGFSSPIQIDPDTNWSQICAAGGHSVALKEDGSLWAWGKNDHGQVGDGGTTNKFAVTLITTDKDWQAIAAGDYNTFALKKDGSLWEWGLNTINGAGDDLAPKPIAPGTNWTAMSAGDFCLLAVRSDGTLWLRGDTRVSPRVAADSGPQVTFIQIGTDKDWKSVFAGGSHFFALKQDGSWWACGLNDCGQLGFDPTSRTDTVDSPTRFPLGFDPWAFASGSSTTLLLTQDGALWTWGQRLGANQSSLGDFAAFLSGAIHRVTGLGRPFKPNIQIDQSPRKLLQIHSEARTSMETNE
jgi:alpha-tubulin suppressor-like RCC1 family protein